MRRRLAKKRPRVEGLVMLILYALNFIHSRQVEIDKQGVPSGRVWATTEEVSMDTKSKRTA
jgi:hypothetical protein